MPNINPIDGAIHFILLIFIEGNNKEKKDADIITPDAKPNKNFSTFLFNLSFIKKTKAEPKVVPKNGIKRPNTKYINHSFPFKLLTISIFFIFLDKNLDTIYDITYTATVAIIYVIGSI